MSVEAGYNQWAATYDEVVNPTGDLEKRACESALRDRARGTVLELGGRDRTSFQRLIASLFRNKE